MKKIKVLHLYYDLLNMYGENGNIRAIDRYLSNHNVNYLVDYKTINDDININNYDLIYIGSGTDEYLEIAQDDFKKYENEIKIYIKNNKFIISTGNSLNLFNKILNFEVKKINFRIIGDQVFQYQDNLTIIGYQNRDTVIKNNNDNYFFKVISGTGYEPNNNYEGIKINNFYGTYLIGPLLVRNPYLLDNIMQDFFKLYDIPYQEIKDEAYKAYDEYINNFITKEN